MSYQSIISREILIPELGIELHVHSIEVPSSLAAVTPHETQKVEQHLVEVCRDIFRLGPSDVLSFSEWARATQQIQKTLAIADSQTEQPLQEARSQVALCVNEVNFWRGS